MAQWRQPALVGAVEADREEMEFAILSGQFVTLANRLAMQGNRTMGHRHALGLAGGAGGVDQIGQLLGVDIHLGRV